MLHADTDYARIVSLLGKQQLAPYVSYQKHDTINGFSGKHGNHVVVRTSDGSIVTGEDSGIEAGDYHHHSNPVTHPTFDRACYRATDETETTYGGRPALRLTLAPTCASKNPHDVEYPFTTLYADKDNMQLLDVNGTVEPTDDNKSVTVALDEQYETFDGRILPSRLKVDVSGSGWMFWLQVHVTETYDTYQFLNSPSA
jgi:hypothetical protein